MPPESARIGIEQQEVGKSAADIYAQPVTHR
jgi:hypothetical protein